ncbi:hypothetical protein IVA98_13320 [Bradyrhizobium sp. 160]|nr:hypothetical protein [Bradyrhizobium sp. 160]
MTPQRYQSGEVDISAGDRMSRRLLFEAANALMTRVRKDSALHRWGQQLMARIGSRKAKLAVRANSPSSCIVSGWMARSSRLHRLAEPS